MSPRPSPVPVACIHCPHYDSFRSTCSHPHRQLIFQAFGDNTGSCPVYSEIRAEAMRDLQNQLE